MVKKRSKQQELIELRNRIFEEKVKQVNYTRRKEEQRGEFKNINEDIELLQNMMGEHVRRKQDLLGKVEGTSMKFKDKAVELAENVRKTKEKLVKAFQRKEDLEDRAEFLMDDRGAGSRKYRGSINKFVEQAAKMKTDFERLHQQLEFFGRELKLETVYQGKKCKFEDIYRTGRFVEREKRDAMQTDLNAKQDFIIEQLADKEELEAQLAMFG